METMPRLVTWTMRFVINVLLTVIRWWEDRHADHTDYRMGHLTGGLWQAQDSLRQIRAGQFEPMQRQSAMDLPESSSLTETAYVRELFRDVPIPLHAAEN